MCNLKKRIYNVSWIFIALFVLVFLVKSLSTFPVQQNIKTGDPIISSLHLKIPRNLSIHLSGQKKNLVFSRGIPVAKTPCQIYVKLKLFGLIPVHKMLVNVVSPPEIMVCGHSIGVFINAQGVIAVGLIQIEDSLGQRHNPAEKAGIFAGDILQKVNHNSLFSAKQLKNEIEKNGRKGRPVILEIKRQKKTFCVKTNPVLCKETGQYKIGLLVRENTAGMGTLTFYDPKTKSYGALGHMVTNIDSCAKLDLSEGQIKNIAVRDIYMGYKGKPGEKIGSFQEKPVFTGNIHKNTPFGIFGSLQQAPKNFFYPRPIPVALAYEITTGPAEILTVLRGEQIESFTIQIEKINTQVNPGGKAITIKVTDENLLRRAGGIVQGMSGSPIIQNGKFIGVVTHVLINDPARGYGAPAEWMLEEAGHYFKSHKLVS